jgi:hypothetical protein
VTKIKKKVKYKKFRDSLQVHFYKKAQIHKVRMKYARKLMVVPFKVDVKKIQDTDTQVKKYLDELSKARSFQPHGAINDQVEIVKQPAPITQTTVYNALEGLVQELKSKNTSDETINEIKDTIKSLKEESVKTEPNESGNINAELQETVTALRETTEALHELITYFHKGGENVNYNKRDEKQKVDVQKTSLNDDDDEKQKVDVLDRESDEKSTNEREEKQKVKIKEAVRKRTIERDVDVQKDNKKSSHDNKKKKVDVQKNDITSADSDEDEFKDFDKPVIIKDYDKPITIKGYDRPDTIDPTTISTYKNNSSIKYKTFRTPDEAFTRAREEELLEASKALANINAVYRERFHKPLVAERPRIGLRQAIDDHLLSSNALGVARSLTGLSYSKQDAAAQDVVTSLSLVNKIRANGNKKPDGYKYDNE